MDERCEKAFSLRGDKNDPREVVNFSSFGTASVHYSSSQQCFFQNNYL